MNVIIKQLAECPHVLPTLATWISNEWWSNQEEGIRVVTELLEANLEADCIPTTLVAFEGETVAGTASLIQRDFGTEAWPQFDPWVAAVYVAPEYRGRGVGSVIMMEMVQLAERLGVADLYLWTKNQAPFYQRLGWQVIDRQPPGDEGAYLLHREIASSSP